MPHTQHTPGPGRIGDAGHTIFEPKSIKMIAQRVSPHNAPLLRAAPDLLAALKEADQWFREMDEAQGMEHELAQGHDAERCVVCTIRAAIRQAEGE